MIAWKTHGAGDSLVEYGLTAAYGRNSSNSALTEDHGLQINGLEADSLYHFRVRSAYLGYPSLSADYTFRTLHVYVANNTGIIANHITSINVSGENLSIDILTYVNVSNASITVESSTNSQVNDSMTVPSLGKYVNIGASQELRDAVSWIMLRIYYTDEELNASGLDESTLAMYWYNTTALNWDKLTKNLPWVYGTGADADQNYVWANVSRFEYYAIGGESLTCSLAWDYAPCGYISLQEVVDAILKWAIDEATLQEVVDLILGWAATV